MKGCILLYGESFRFGCQNNRNIGSDQSYDEQINAANSHMSFIKDLNNKNVDIDIYISSYMTKFTIELIKVYKEKLIGYDFYKYLLGPEQLIHNTLNKIVNIEQYNFLLIMRIDLFLKNKFTEIFNKDWNKILWASICFKPYHMCGIHPRVNDTMIFVPKKYYNYLKYLRYNDGVGHLQWLIFINETDLKYDDLDTMITTFHDSDSFKDLNPLYYIVNREESKISHTNESELFNKFDFN